MGLYDDYSAGSYGGGASSEMPGGSLADYFSTNRGPQGQPFAPRSLYENPEFKSYARALQEQGIELPYIDPQSNSARAVNPDYREGGNMPRFLNFNAPKLGRVQRAANSAYNKGYAALAAYNALYPATLDLTRRQVADYGDLHRRAANDQLGFDLYASGRHRAADQTDFANLGPEYVANLRKSNPLLGQYYDTAQSDLALGDQLSPSQRRNIAQSVRAGQAARGMGVGPSDVYEEAIQTSGYGDVLREQRMGNARGALGLYGDVFQATTGRPTMSPQPAGANVMAPNVGTGSEDWVSYLVNRQIQNQNLGAAKDASQMALYGSIIEGVGSIAGGAIACWVAREVFGRKSAKWRLFRRWLFTRGPKPLLRKYLRHGQEAAKWLRRHRELVPALRAMMEAKIAELSTPSPLNGERAGVSENLASQPI